jgi:deferrochelatase/peroxidase EfeB
MPTASRRFFLAASAGAIGAATASAAAPAAASADPVPGAATEPFHGPHQAGILTRQQGFSYFAVFDLTAQTRGAVVALLRRWTDAAARLTAGEAVDGKDSGESLGLPPARLTLTFGFGPGLFVRDGRDRYGLLTQRPAALIDLPAFPGDRLDAGRTGGDVSVQACAEDAQTAFHAIRQLSGLAEGSARLRWLQAGFLPDVKGQTPRNLLGFKDGTQNINQADPFAFSAYVWAGMEGPAWMRGGTYLVARRIRLALLQWDATPQAEQERIIGRAKASGAPLGGTREFDPERFHATGADGAPLIADNAHIRVASFDSSKARILRRGYSFTDGLDGADYDAGLLFMAYQKDPRTGFVTLFEAMSRRDRLNNFATHVGSGVFAIPPGVQPGGFIGETLFA